jgi:integrase
MLKMAAQDGKIPRSPTIGVKPGKRTSHETEEHRYLTHAEFWAVVDATPAYWQPLVITLGGTGIRWGELAALTVGDVDTETGYLRITKAEKQDPDHPSRTIIGPPKTKKARRSVSLPPEVLEALEPLREGRKRNDRLFLPPNGGPLRHRTFYRDIWLRKSVGQLRHPRTLPAAPRPAPQPRRLDDRGRRLPARDPAAAGPREDHHHDRHLRAPAPRGRRRRARGRWPGVRRAR